MKFTIEDLKNGKCAVKNDGTTEELREVLMKAFPDDPYSKEVGGISTYYCMDNDDTNSWTGEGYIRLPTQSVKDFLTEPNRKVPNLAIEDKVLEMWEYYQKQKVVEGSDDTNSKHKTRAVRSTLYVNDNIVKYEGDYNSNVEELMEKEGILKNFHAYIENCIDTYFDNYIDTYFDKYKEVDISKWYGDFDDN